MIQAVSCTEITIMVLLGLVSTFTAMNFYELYIGGNFATQDCFYQPNRRPKNPLDRGGSLNLFSSFKKSYWVGCLIYSSRDIVSGHIAMAINLELEWKNGLIYS